MAKHLEPTADASTQSQEHQANLHLLRELLLQGKPFWRSFSSKINEEEAQTIIDFLSKVLNERHDVNTDEAKQILSVIRMVATSIRVYPTSCKLDGVVCNFSVPLTSGGFADIFRGQYQGHAVCVKKVYLEVTQDNTSRVRAQAKEFALWAHLSHPNILPFLGVYEPPKQRKSDMICIVSQYMPNGNLFTYVKKVLDCPKLLLLFDVVSGLKYLHDNDIIHADLKAANVVVSETGHAMICDFGISRIRSGFSTTNAISIGTKSWTAPELFRDDDPKPTEKSDIWSFGCLCYEVMMSEPPYNRYSDYQLVLNLVLHERNPFDASDQDIDQIDLWLRLLMKKCWDYEPSRRPTSKDIYEQFEKMDIQDNRSPLTNDDPALKEVKRVKVGVEINHEEVCGVLQKASRCILFHITT
ncbi:putative serine/threonine-protein kinase drkC [Leucoagaricus sp. SymC.cos]|nr:putative serine/threonine-protein kinase drkC [Leucoagaricus sp. SymC.cos]